MVVWEGGAVRLLPIPIAPDYLVEPFNNLIQFLRE
jgi:hypothetical protein